MTSGQNTAPKKTVVQKPPERKKGIRAALAEAQKEVKTRNREREKTYVPKRDNDLER